MRVLMGSAIAAVVAATGLIVAISQAVGARNARRGG